MSGLESVALDPDFEKISPHFHVDFVIQSKTKLAYETCYHWQSVTGQRCAIAHHVLQELAIKYITSEIKEQVPYQQ